MKWLIVISAVVVAAAALPAPDAAVAAARKKIVDIASTANATFQNTALAGFGAGTIGGAGGAVWTVWDPWALRDALNSAAPRIIYVRGRIDLTQLFTGSPGVILHCGPYKTIIGGDANAEIFGGGIRMVNQVHVIIQRIKFNNALSYAPGEMPNGNGGILSQVPGEFANLDAIDIEHCEFIWVDHCEFSDDPWNANTITNDRKRHDGLVDMKNRASWITISNNIFRNHNLVSLIGHNDNHGSVDIGRLKVTYYLNWFQGTIQRNPRVRYGEVHILNNLYSDVSSYGIGIGAGAQVYGERNAFVNTRRSWGFASGVPNPAGFFFNDNNLLVNSAHDSGVPNGVSFRPNQYYGYTPMAASSVEAHVRRHAGTW